MKKRHKKYLPLVFLLTLIIDLCYLQAASAQSKWNQAYQIYINQYRDLAIEQMKKYKIPASITLAQGLLESAAGRSELAVNGNNHFGIKCHDWTGKKAYHDDDAEGECFRAYDNAFQSYEDHSRWLSTQPRYRSLFSLSLTDYKGWATTLKQCGYATNPAYAQKLINIIELYKLWEYDKATSYDHFMTARAQKESPTTNAGINHPIHAYNKNYYVVAKSGDTFVSIARELGLSYRKIARYNERPSKSSLQSGDFVYLKKKQKRAERQYKKRQHVVKAGDSMYSIAQYYGIRLKSLYKMNGLSSDYTIRIGDKLKVR